MYVEKLTNGLPYAFFSFDEHADLHEGDVAQRALGYVRPRYLRHPEQNTVSTLLANEINGDGTRQYHKKTDGIAIPLYPEHAQVLAKALQLFADDVLSGSQRADTKSAIPEVDILDAYLARTMALSMAEEVDFQSLALTNDATA